jgi:hypothetical protein
VPFYSLVCASNTRLPVSDKNSDKVPRKNVDSSKKGDGAGLYDDKEQQKLIAKY